MRELDQPIQIKSAVDVGYTGAVQGAMMQIVYGDHETEVGTIPCQLFKVSGGVYYWLASGKAMNSIGTIYVDGVADAVSFTAYTNDDLESLGSIAYLTTTTDFGFKRVSCKGKGRMDGSSNLIENPILVLKQGLIDVAEAQTSDFESASIAQSEQICASQNYKFAGIIEDNSLAVEKLILKMCREFLADFWKNADEELVVKVDTGSVDTQEIAGNIFREDLVEKSVVLEQSLEWIVSNLLMKYRYDYTNRRYLGIKDGNEDANYKDVNSINAYGNTPQRVIGFKWVRDDTHISAYKDVLFAKYNGVPHPPSHIRFTTRNLKHHTIEAGDIFRFSFDRFYKNGVPMANEVLKANQADKDFDGKKVLFATEDMEVTSDV